MGSAVIQGELWGRAPGDWAHLQESQHRPLWEAMLDGTGVGNDTRMLDAGCGGGGACVLAADRGAQVSGVDASEALLEVARDRVPGGDFRVADLEALPFPDRSFGAVIAASSVQYAADVGAALRELARVAADDGRLAVGLFSTPDKVDIRVIFDALRDLMPAAPPGAGPFALSAPGVLEALVEEAGMEVLSSGEAACPFAYPDVGTFLRAILAGGPVQRVLDAAGADAVQAALVDAAAPHRRADGSYRFANNAFRFVVARPR